jgi:hypothetical protein
MAVPARATEVPPSPVRIVQYGAIIDSIPPLPIGVEGAEAQVRAACEEGYELIFGGRRADVCSTTAQQQNRCYYVDIEPAFISNGTSVGWKPYFQAGCYVRPGTTISAIFSYSVTSTFAGTIGGESGERFISQAQKQFSMGNGGRRDCVRTAGTYEVVTLTARVQAGGVDQTSTFQILCN